MHDIIISNKIGGHLQANRGIGIMYYYQRIRDLREDADKSQSEIASLLDMKRQQYARYENGVQEIPPHHLITLAKYYKVSLDFIAGLTN